MLTLSETYAASFAETRSNALESLGVARVPVMLSAAARQAVSIDYEVVGGSALGSGGDRDYTLSAGTLTFGIGEATRDIEIELVNDSSAEHSETIELRLSDPSPNALLWPLVTHTFTIVSDDPFPPVSTPASREYWNLYW